MLLSSGLSNGFWVEALLHAAYIHNRLPTCSNNGISPYERLYGKSPLLSKLSPFSALGFLLKPEREQSKLGPRTVDAIFLSMKDDTQVYRLWLPSPEGFISPEHLDWVCLLNKSLYGLKQAPYVWNRTFKKHLKRNGFRPTLADPCIFIKRSGRDITLISVYVDDLLFLGNCKQVNAAKKLIAERFPIKDLGPVKSILGIEVYRDRLKRTTTLRQRGYIHAVLKRFSMENCKLMLTPMVSGLQLPKLLKPTKCRAPYGEAIGSLLYLTLDITYAVTTLARHTNEYDDLHWSAVKRVLRYLQTTRDQALTYSCSQSSPTLIGYCHADWAGDTLTGLHLHLCFCTGDVAF